MLKKTPNKDNNLVIVKHQSFDGNIEYILEVKELRELKDAFVNLGKDIKYKDKTNLYKKCNTFFDWYINYVDSILKGKKYDNDKIAEIIFLDQLENKKHFTEYLKKSLFISKEYIEYLKNSIKTKYVHRYKEVISSLHCDLEWLIAKVEFHINKYPNRIVITSGRRPYLSTYDISSSINDLFFIEEYDKIDDLYLRDLKPVVMFQIRQLLEIYGKNLIGYNSILDGNGIPIKKFTQVAWEFIKKEVKNKSSRIELPFNIDMIMEINRWANSFVHSTYIYSSYIQFFAINCIKDLFKDTKIIELYNGKSKYCIEYGSIKIENYNSLKQDFEKYLNDKHKGGTIKIDWKDIDNVGAHIASL
jgi:hypothetical protein